jgi:tetratricopeptide (TPR) repeat protein/DNA-binding winged helix-turn-helix (wHTH) protein
MDEIEPEVVDKDTQITIEPALREGFMLGHFLVFPNKDVVMIDQAQHHISHKAMDVLMLLCSADGRIVSRKVILSIVWGRKMTGGASVSAAISELRRLWNDSKERPNFIQTIPKVGYRLLQPVAPLEDSLLTAETLKQVAAIEDRSNPHRPSQFIATADHWRKSHLFKVAGTYIVMAWVLMQVVSVTIPVVDAPVWFDKFALLLLIIGFPLVLAYNWWLEARLRKRFLKQHTNNNKQNTLSRYAVLDLVYISVFSCFSIVFAIMLGGKLLEATSQVANLTASQQPEIKAELQVNAVAVMPFKQLGAQSSDYLVDQLQTEVLSFLSSSTQLRVVSERVLASIPDDATLATIRNRSGAKYILEGVIDLQQDTVQIVTTITDSESGHQVWSNKIAQPIDNQLALLDTLSQQVHNALTFLMPGSRSASPQFRPTNDIHAFDFYMRAKAALKNAYNENQLKNSEQLFLQALSRDPSFTLAQAGLCTTYLEQYYLLVVNNIFELAQQTCQSIEEEGVAKSEATVALGRLYFLSGEYQRAREYYKKALQTDPNNSLAIVGLAKTHAKLGNIQQSESLFQNAIRTEPGYWLNYEQYGIFLFDQGQYQAASLQFSKQSFIQPKSEEAWNNLGAAYYLNTDFEKASLSWQKAVDMNPSANIYSNLGTSSFFAKHFDKAVEMYNLAVQMNPNNYVFRGNLADALKYVENQKIASQTQFKIALDLATKSAQINPNDLSTQASIARYHAELSQCVQADSIVQRIEQKSPDDPYIYYDLALIAIHCADSKQVVKHLKKMLSLGYSTKLILSDHQFTDFTTELRKQRKSVPSK